MNETPDRYFFGAQGQTLTHCPPAFPGELRQPDLSHQVVSHVTRSTDG